VDVYVINSIDSGLVQQFNDLNFCEATAVIPVPSNTPFRVVVAPSNSSSLSNALANSLYSVPFTILPTDKSCVLTLSGLIDPAAFTANPDGELTDLKISRKDSLSLTTSNGVDLLVYQGVTDAAAMDISLNGTIQLANSILYGKYNGYTNVPVSSNYSFDVRSNTIAYSYNLDLTGLAGQRVVLFTSGFVDSLQNLNAAFDVWAALEDGTTYSLSSTSPLFYSVITTDTNACPGETITLQATTVNGQGPFSYLWSGPGLTSTTGAGVTAVIPGGISSQHTYTLRVVDNVGDTVISSLVISAKGIGVYLGADTTLFCGVPYLLHPSISGAAIGLSYIWGNGSNSSSQNIISGTHTVTVTNAYGCTASDTIVATGPTAQTLSFSGPASVCTDSSVTFINTSSQINGWTWTWHVSGGAGGFQVNQTDLTHTFTSAGTLIIELVGDSAACSISYSDSLHVVSCSPVWPGDANNDNIVDLNDVLNIGRAWSGTGSGRANASLIWAAQPSPDWLQNMAGVNYKHIDCDGNGTINDDDTLAVSQNWSLTHLKAGAEPRATDPVLYLEPVRDTLYSNANARFNIMLGSNAIPVSDLYGIAFSVILDPSVFDLSSANITTAGSFMGTAGTDMFTFRRFDSQGISIALSRTDGQNVSGNGKIGELTLRTNSIGDATGSVTLMPVIVKGLAASGAENTYNTQTTSLTIADTSVGINEPAVYASVNIYPNPAKGVVYIQAPAAVKSTTWTVSLLNMDGRLITQEVLNNGSLNNHAINTTGISAGIYFLRISGDAGVTVKKVVLQ
jgi:hypothetical protein